MHCAYHFTGKERDTESGNDYFLARYYGSITGRFISPDPSGLAYAEVGNPQSLNLYGYVRNNPLAFVDPTGLACVNGADDDRGGESCAYVAKADADYKKQGKASLTVYADDFVDSGLLQADRISQNIGMQFAKGQNGSQSNSGAQWTAARPLPLNSRNPDGVSDAQMRCENGLLLNATLHGVGSALSQLKSAGGEVAKALDQVKSYAPVIGAYGAETATALGVGAEGAAVFGGLASGTAETAGVVAIGYVGYSGAKGFYDYMADPANSCAGIP